MISETMRADFADRNDFYVEYSGNDSTEAQAMEKAENDIRELHGSNLISFRIVKGQRDRFNFLHYKLILKHGRY